MSSLTALEKRRFENLFGMSSGYVLDFTNSTFAEFFRESAHIDIYAPKYSTNGDSKAKRLRAFWEIEPSETVGHVLCELLEVWRYTHPQPDAKLAAEEEACARIAERLRGKSVPQEVTEDEFLHQDLGDVSLAGVLTDEALVAILEDRLAEATACLRAGAPLAVVFLCGSLLEGLLQGVAGIRPREFNQAQCSPKDQSGKVRPFGQWSLAELINVAHETGHLRRDVQRFSHALRDFRNYIHPLQQRQEGFTPDRHTARICIQVLRAAIADLSGEGRG